jgi:uncharacterized protein
MMPLRRFGKLGWEASILGFGCMRLPTTAGGSASAVDEKAAVAMIRAAIDRGVNYVDTAYPYHDGRSEVVLGRALKDGYRERVKVSTKSPVWLIKRAADFDSYLNEQLGRLDIEHIDIYLLHALSAARWASVRADGILEQAEAAVKDGRIGAIGFSFHDGAAVFPGILDDYDGWKVVQIQYNYMDTHNQAGTAGLRLAAARGLAVVVMEPLLGGRLANPPNAVRAAFENAERELRTRPGASPADWALQWIWDQPEATVVLSGMTTMGQVEENLRSAERARVGSFGPDDFALIERARAAFLARTTIPCTQCGYCLPCPSGVNIPRNFELYNNGFIYDDLRPVRFSYQQFFPENERADLCRQCRTCQEKCPQAIEIADWMPRVHEVLGGTKP